MGPLRAQGWLRLAAVLAVASAMLFSFVPPASAQQCPTQNPDGSIQCGAGNSWNGGTCQPEATCSAPKTQLSCASGTCVCPSATPNDCTGVNGLCQTTNATCATQSRQSVCNPAGGATTQICGGCLTGYTDCSGTCRSNTDASCPAPGVWNACGQTCSVPYVQRSPSVEQASTYIDISGNVEAAGFCFNGGSCLTAPTGNDTVLGDGQVSVGTNPVSGAADYTLDVFSDGDALNNGDTAIIRITDADATGDLWTGFQIADYDSGTNTNDEEWFIGTGSSGDTNYLGQPYGNELIFREDGSIDVMTVSSDGVHINTTTNGDALTVGYADSLFNAILKAISREDAGLVVEADTDNSGEDDNAYIQLLQDGGTVSGSFGFVGAAGTDSLGAAYTGTTADALLLESSTAIQFGVDGRVVMSLEPSGDITVSEFITASDLCTAGGICLSAVALPSGVANQILRHDGTGWIATSAAQVTSTGTILAANGAVGTPAHSFVSDTNTGMYSGGADIIRFATAGANRMSIAAGGAVSIGNTTTTSLLNVGSSAQFQVNSTGSIVASAGINTTGMTTLGAGSLTLGAAQNLLYGNIGAGPHNATSSLLLLQNNASTVFRVDTGGNVTANGLTLPTGAQAGYVLTASGASGVASWQPTGGLWELVGGTGPDIYYDAGQVGIGTTTPSYDIDVEDSVGSVFMNLFDNSGGRIYTGIRLARGGAAPGTEQWYVGMNSTDDHLHLGKTGLGGYITMRSDGNVGIGTTEPTQRLQIVNGGGNGAVLSLVGAPTTGVQLQQSGWTWLFGMTDTDETLTLRSQGVDDVLSINEYTNRFRIGINTEAPLDAALELRRDVGEAAGSSVRFYAGTSDARLQINESNSIGSQKVMEVNVSATNRGGAFGISPLVDLRSTPLNPPTTIQRDYLGIWEQPTYNGTGLGAVTLSSSNVFLTRWPVLSGSFDGTLAVNGALIDVQDYVEDTAAAGTFTHTGEVMRLRQFTTSASGPVLRVDNDGVGSSLYIDNGPVTESFVIDANGGTSIGTTTAPPSGFKLYVTNGAALSTDFCLDTTGTQCLSDALAVAGSGLPTGSFGQMLRHNGTAWVPIDSLAAGITVNGAAAGYTFAVNGSTNLTSDVRAGLNVIVDTGIMIKHGAAETPGYAIDINSNTFNGGIKHDSIINLNQYSQFSTDYSWLGIRIARFGTERWFLGSVGGSTSTQDDFVIQEDGNTSDVPFRIKDGTGYVGIAGGAAVIYALDVNGSGYFNGDLTATGSFTASGGNWLGGGAAAATSNSFAWGTNSRAQTSGSIALGTNHQIYSSTQAIAIGDGIWIDGAVRAIGIGRTNYSNVAIGSGKANTISLFGNSRIPSVFVSASSDVNTPGSVGIGTDAPAAGRMLDVAGIAEATDFCTQSGTCLSTAGGGGGGGTVLGTGVADRIAYWTDGTTIAYDTALAWDSANNRLGIGKSSAVARLDVAGGSAAWNETTPGLAVGGLHLDPESASANVGSAITFGASDIGNGETAQAGIYTRTDDTYGSKMYLATTDAYGSGAKTRVMIDSDGNIGIGNTNPSTLLDIGSTSLATTVFTMRSAGTAGIEILADSTSHSNEVPYIYLQDYVASNSAAILGYTIGANLDSRGTGYTDARDGALLLGTTLGAPDPVQFGSGGVVRMSVYSTGVGIGLGNGLAGTMLHVRASNNTVATFDRTTADGTIVNFMQDSAGVGTISVSGSTVSYNAFTGSHYAQSDVTVKRGRLVRMNGENSYVSGGEGREIIYGVEETSRENDPAVLGSMLGLEEGVEDHSDENPYLVMAVGNGVMWVVDEGEDLAPGDYLISSGTVGHARKDPGTYAIAYAVARVAEPVDWATVTERAVDGKKHALVSVLFENAPLFKLGLDDEGRITDVDLRVTELEDRVDRLERELMELQLRMAQ